MAGGDKLRQTFALAEQSAANGYSIGDAVKSIFSFDPGGIFNFLSKKTDGLRDYFLKVFNYDNDNIAVPIGTKTLLGKDISTLYESVQSKSYTTNLGGTFEAVESVGSYKTEMHNLKSDKWISYDLCSPENKAVFELTLLAKKSANDCFNQPDVTNRTVSSYMDTVVAYRDYCDKNDMNFEAIMKQVSWELQAESYDYSQNASKLFNVEGDSERVLANGAHQIINTTMESLGIEDSLLVRLSGKTTLAETLDTAPSDNSSISVKAVNGVTNMCTSIRDTADKYNPIKAARTIATNVETGVRDFTVSVADAVLDDDGNPLPIQYPSL